MHFKRSLIASVLPLIFFSCSQTVQNENTADSMNNTQSSGVDIQPDLLALSHDPVCGMSMLQSKIGDTLTVEGKVYAFCNSTCKKHFAENPTEYLPQETLK